MTESQTRSFTLPNWLWYQAGALVYLSFGFTEMMGGDLWWHMAAGREMVQQGTIWAADSWSYTAPDRVWHNHEWLADLVFFAWVSAFGVASLVVWKWSLLILTFCLLQRVLHKLSQNAAAALIGTAIGICIAAPFLDIRPHLYSLLGVSVLLNLCVERTPRLRELLPLFLIWVNLHGGFIFGLMLLPFVLIPRQELSLSSLRTAVLKGLACGGVCLVNPDGYRVFAMPLVYALDSESPFRGIAEWRPPFEAGGIVSPYYPYSLVVGAALALTWLLPTVRRYVPINWPVLGIAALTAAMSLTSRRFITLWAVALALLLAPFLGALLRRRVVERIALPILVLAMVWAVWRIDAYSLQPRVAYHYLTGEYGFPHGIADVVELNDLEGDTFAYYGWGGFLHWRTDGALKVFIDGRANTLYDDQTYEDYVAVLRRAPDWIAHIESSGAQYFLWPHNRRGRGLIRGLLATKRWSLAYEDVRGTLLSREPVANLQEPAGGFNRQLIDARRSSLTGNVDDALDAARRAHSMRPWDLEACRWLELVTRQQIGAEDAEAVTTACRRWFDSAYL